MLDLRRGPLLVAVADRPAAIINTAESDHSTRTFDLVEARVDLFAQQSLDGCAHDCARLEASGTPVILTIRSAAQGGRFAGPDTARLSAFTAAIAGGHASWVDVENDATIVDALAAVVAARTGAQLIVSHHDFARTPPLDALLAVVDRCHSVPGAIAKIATAVRSDGDRQTLLDLLARRPDRTCVIGMGASADLRIELAARGSLLAYGYLEQATAPGQMSAAETHQRLLAASPAYAARRAST
ncbi:MAG TPA: type I 3-dehydroquinate dehydratase [Polyangia bacterium]|jgi:3-dehydroquinate dehydratase-1|nr:type I 3-dehydroquinate dehydratase [Polyangia bacterium]